MKTKFFLFFYLPFFALAQDYTPTSNGEIVKHNYYTLSYLENHEQAEWVYYLLTKEMVNGGYKRTDNFRTDPLVSTKSAQLIDYKGSGYDRGHLAPAADMKQTSLSMSESFYLSNMAPQHPSFNRGAWKKLEELFRCWINAKDSIYITTGGVLTSDLVAIGINDVSVPNYYYKIAYSVTDNKMIAFLMPNEKLYEPLKSYVVTVDEIEGLTNINFYPGIDEKLEQEVILKDWNFTCKTSYHPQVNTTNTNHSNTKGRCQATTQSGNQCKRNA